MTEGGKLARPAASAGWRWGWRASRDGASFLVTHNILLHAATSTAPVYVARWVPRCCGTAHKKHACRCRLAADHAADRHGGVQRGARQRGGGDARLRRPIPLTPLRRLDRELRLLSGQGVQGKNAQFSLKHVGVGLARGRRDRHATDGRARVESTSSPHRINRVSKPVVYSPARKKSPRASTRGARSRDARSRGGS